MKFLLLASALILVGCSSSTKPEPARIYVEDQKLFGATLTLIPGGAARLDGVTIPITCGDQTYDVRTSFTGSWTTSMEGEVASGFLEAEDLPDDLGPMSAKFYVHSSLEGFTGSVQALTWPPCNDGAMRRSAALRFTLVPLED